MPQQAMFISEFLKRVLQKIYDVCDVELHPTNSELRAQNILSITRQICDRVPSWFLEEFLEATKNPERTVENAVKAFRETAHPFPSMTTPSESLSACILEGAIPQVVHALVVEIFGPLIMVDQSSPPRLKFTNDIIELYAFLMRKTTEESIREEEKADNEATGAGSTNSNDDNGEIHFVPGSEDKALLIQNCSDAIFSVHLLIKRLLGHKDKVRTGQYI